VCYKSSTGPRDPHLLFYFPSAGNFENHSYRKQMEQIVLYNKAYSSAVTMILPRHSFRLSCEMLLLLFMPWEREEHAKNRLQVPVTYIFSLNTIHTYSELPQAGDARPDVVDLQEERSLLTLMCTALSGTSRNLGDTCTHLNRNRFPWPHVPTESEHFYSYSFLCSFAYLNSLDAHEL